MNVHNDTGVADNATGPATRTCDECGAQGQPAILHDPDCSNARDWRGDV